MRSSRYRRERGVTAVIVAIVIAVLCAFVALVINSGHIMSVRGQLQNATDAAALAGVRRLDGTAAGFDNARAAAQAYAALHITDKAQNVTITGADVVIGSWNFTAPSADAFTPITGTSPAQLAAANAVLVNAGRQALRGNPVQVAMGELPGAPLGRTQTDVSAQSVAVMGGPSTECPMVPLAFSSCSLLNPDGSVKCDQTLVFNSNNNDNIGFTNLTASASVNTPELRSILQGNCQWLNVGDPISISNGTNLQPLVTDFGAIVGKEKIAPVVDVPGCMFNLSGTSRVIGFVTITVTNVISAPTKMIEIEIDCNETTLQPAPAGGAFFGLPATPRLVR